MFGVLQNLLKLCVTFKDVNLLKDWKKATSKALKGQCHEIFDPRFFSSNNPP
jgi:hypothetical protein